MKMEALKGGYAATSQGMPKAASKPPAARRGQEVFLMTLTRNQHLTSDCKILSHAVSGFLLWQSWETRIG